MKNIILFLLLIAFTKGYTQGLLTFFTKEGEKFWVVIDGKKINQEPQYLVEKISVDMKYGKAKIIFEDPKLGSVDKTYQVVDVDGNWCHVKYMIRKDNKGKKYVIRDIDATYEIINKPSSVPSSTQNSQQVSPAQSQITPSQTTQQTTTTTTTPTQTTTIGINVNETPTGVSIQTNVPGIQQTTQTTVVTHQTTTTSTSTPPTTQTQITMTPQQEITKPYVLPGYNGPIGCPRPMNDGDFQSALNTIKSKSFEDSKLTIAKQITSSNCLLSTQVRDIAKSFSFESSRLEYAKFAYKYTYDKGNYFKVNEAFQFESSIDELNEYLQSGN